MNKILEYNDKVADAIMGVIDKIPSTADIEDPDKVYRFYINTTIPFAITSGTCMGLTAHAALIEDDPNKVFLFGAGSALGLGFSYLFNHLGYKDSLKRRQKYEKG